jgi:hypothetical protein
VIGLLDNDAIFKLAACDLLGEFLKAIGITPDDVFVHPAAAYQIPASRGKQDKVDRYTTEGLDRAAEFVRSVRVVERVKDEEVAALAQVREIDDGEAILFAATAFLSDCRLITGDKRSLRALMLTRDCDPILKRIEGRVICFEQTVLMCIRQCGFDEVKRRVLPVIGCDTALRVAFGSGEQAQETSVIETLESYIGELRATTGSLLWG